MALPSRPGGAIAMTVQHQKPQASASIMARRYVARGRCADMSLREGSTALFKDPLLMAVLRNDVDQMASMRKSLEAMPWNSSSQYPATSRNMLTHARAHHMNSMLQDALGAHPEGSRLQVVALGCGYDTRPWLPGLGLERHDTAWFGVDAREVVEAVRGEMDAAGARLARTTRTRAAVDGGGAFALRAHSVSYVSCDLRAALARDAAAAAAVSAGNHDDTTNATTGHRASSQEAAAGAAGAEAYQGPGLVDALCDAGFDPGLPTLWTAEGLLYYLPGGSVAALARATSGACGPASSLCADAVGANMPALVALRKEAAAKRGAAAANASGMAMENFMVWGSDDPAAFFAQHGWPLARRQVCAHEAAAALGRGTLNFTHPRDALVAQVGGEVRYTYVWVAKP